jgi:hypothetical protein
MARYRHIQNSFIGGEISPAAFGRTDIDLFSRSVSDLKNMVVKSKGGAARRSGTEFITSAISKYNLTTAASLGSSSWPGYAKIIPFIFSRDEAYAIILETNKIGFINVDTLAVGTYSHDVALLSSFNLFTGFASNTQLDEIQYAQTGDLIFIVHPSHAPLLFARTGTNTFIRYAWWDPPSPVAIHGVNDQAGPGIAFPYLTVNENTSHTMNITGASGTTLTSSTAFFTSANVGSVFKLSTGGLTNYFFVTAFTSTTVVTGFSGNGYVASGPFGPTNDWEESAFSPRRGYPRSVALFEQRVYYGGTSYKPDTVYASKIGDLFELDARGVAPFATPTALSPFSYTVAATEVNQTQWLSPGRSLVHGTAGQEFIASGSSGALSAVDISVSSETNYGSAHRQAVRSENVVNFISRNALTIREFVFNRDQDSFTADDITRFADHLSNKFLTLTAEDNSPFFKFITKQDAGTIILWAIDSNGGLFGLSRDRFTGVTAWHYHVFGGALNDLAPRVESIAVLPAADGTTDDLWLAITRDINGSEVTYIERINKEYARDSILNDSTSITDKPVYVDAAKYQTGAATDTITGLSHLEGEEVQVVGDGFYLGTFTVTGNQVVVPDDYEEFIVGLAFESALKTLPLEAGSGLGVSQHAISRIDKIGIRFFNTIGAKFGYNSSDLETIIFRKTDTPLNEPIDLFTGDKILDMTQDYDRRNEVIVKQDLPFPLHVVCMTFRGVTYD